MGRNRATYSVVLIPTEIGINSNLFKRRVIASGLSKHDAQVVAHEEWCDDPVPDKSDYYAIELELDNGA